MNQTVALHTLGCKLNFSETASLGRLLEQEGFVQKPFEESADLYVINTCSVTENADKECRQLVRRVLRQSPEAMVVITGCYAQLKPQDIASIPGVNLVLGAAEKFNIVQHLKALKKNDSAKICSCDIEEVQEFAPSHSLHERTRVFLKVQDGCDYSCTFCTIPRARGRSRSNRIDGVLEQIHQIAAAGAQEIVLTGINLGDFGKGPEGGRLRDETFFDLMKAIEEQAPPIRFRISSIEPNLITEEMIDFISTSRRFQPHLHMPLQSGNNKTLADMKRRYRRELYAERVALVKQKMPDACIGADVIVGFPGETDEDFRESMRFISDLDISYLHVFTYSERDHTEALDIKPVVPMPVRQERNRMLRQLSYLKMQQFTESQKGKIRKVLFEGANKNGVMEGYSDNYVKVSVAFRPEWENQVMEWPL